MTQTGGGLNDNCSFNTFGMKHNEITKEKMKTAWRQRLDDGFIPNKGRKFSKETIDKMSRTRKGICWIRNRKIEDEEINNILITFHNKTVKFPVEYLRSKVKSSQKDEIEKLQVDELISMAKEIDEDYST